MAILQSASRTSKPHRASPMDGVRFIHLSRRAPAAPSFKPRPAALGQPAGLSVPETPCNVHGCPEPPVTLQVPSLRNAAALHPTTAGHTHTHTAQQLPALELAPGAPGIHTPSGPVGDFLRPTAEENPRPCAQKNFPLASLSKNICEKQNCPRYSPCPSLPDWYPISLPFWNNIERDPAGLVLQQRSVAITGPWLERDSSADAGAAAGPSLPFHPLS
ncbi:hypothetical protein HDV57DRAFT_154018 [Trichoderma longibrachiatum]